MWILMLGWIGFNAELRVNYSAHKYSDCLVNEQSRRRVAVIPNPPPHFFMCSISSPPLSLIKSEVSGNPLPKIFFTGIKCTHLQQR